MLQSLTDVWTANITTMCNAKDLIWLSFEQLIDSRLMTHEVLVESKNDKRPVRGAAWKGIVEGEEHDIIMMAKLLKRHFRYQRKNIKGKFVKKTNSLNVGYFKCGEFKYIIRDCPKWKDQ